MEIRKMTGALLAAVLCVGLCACGEEKKPEPTAPSREDKPIMSISTQPAGTQPAVTYTPVYATAFGDTIYLATVPIDTLEGQEPSCDIREVSLGGQIHCGQTHEVDKEQVAVTRVVIMEELYPTATADWFRGMASLTGIEGLRKLHTDGVMDMSHMFTGCVSLSTLDADGWEVSQVEDMSGIFEGCDALAEKPAWYEP